MNGSDSRGDTRSGVGALNQKLGGSVCDFLTSITFLGVRRRNIFLSFKSQFRNSICYNLVLR